MNRMNRVPIVAIDPGHGYAKQGGESDFGVVWEANHNLVRESDYVWEVGRHMQRELVCRQGLGAYLTRARYGADSYSERAKDVVAVGAGVVVCLHVDTCPTNPDAAGPWAVSRDSNLGDRIVREVAQRCPVRPTVRGTKYPTKHDPWLKRADAVLQHYYSKCLPAVLVELGFVSNQENRDWLDHQKTPRTLGKALAAGVAGWFNS